MWKWGCEQYHRKEIGNQESTKKKEKRMRKRGNLREREQDSALLSMVVHTCNPDSLETEEGGL